MTRRERDGPKAKGGVPEPCRQERRMSREGRRSESRVEFTVWESLREDRRTGVVPEGSRRESTTGPKSVVPYVTL